MQQNERRVDEEEDDKQCEINSLYFANHFYFIIIFLHFVYFYYTWLTFAAVHGGHHE